MLKREDLIILKYYNISGGICAEWPKKGCRALNSVYIQSVLEQAIISFLLTCQSQSRLLSQTTSV